MSCDETQPTPIRLADLGPAFRWLENHGVITARLAEVIGIEPGYLRVLKHRAEHSYFNAPADSIEGLLNKPTDQLRRRLGVRPHEDSVTHWRATERRIEALEDEIDTVREEHAAVGQFGKGLAKLRVYESRRGYPSSALWFRFSARLHEHRAWFLVHSGMATSAYEEARLAIDYSRLAYKEREDSFDLKRLIESCLIGSLACILAGNPQVSLNLLDLVAEAAERISELLGSEYYRQRGTAHLLLADTETSRKYFERVESAMDRKREARSQGQLWMAGRRHLALLLSPNVDLSAEIMERVDKDFPAGSLERVMMRNWTAACALATDSSPMHAFGQELLARWPEQPPTFGHQATRAFLLQITPSIGLDQRYWRAWIYRALYENAFRSR